MYRYKSISTIFSVLVLITGTVIFGCNQASVANSSDKYINGQLFVKVNDASSINLLYASTGDRYPNGLKEIIKKYRVTDILKAFILNDAELSKTYLIRFDEHAKALQLISKLSGLDYIEYAEKVPLYKTSLTPNDLHPNQWHLTQIQAEAAWDITTGSASVVIAIVDDAVLLSHEDLAPVIWVNPGEIPGNGIDDDGNGYIDDINGWDAADNDNDPNPVNPTNSYFTHGTHCSGIAAAATNNSIGIASISYNVKLMAIKTATNGSGTLPAAYLGVQYAIAANADIISMSWGGGAYSQTYQNLFNLAHSEGIVLIAAAGNSNTTIPAYPASYNYVISVGATNSADQKAWFSNYGSTIDVMAPGEDIWSSKAGSNSSYDYLSGTSMACPLVSGLAALMLSRDPSLTPDELEACLKSTCDNIDAQNPGYVGQIGAGRINAYQALLCLKPISAEFTSDYRQVCPGDTVQFTDLSTNNPLSWQWSFSGGTPSNSTQQNPMVVYNTPGTYDVTLTVTNIDSTDTITKTNHITVAVPTATISGSATIPVGFSANLRVDLTGNPNWSITYFDGTSNTTINNITNSPYYITVTPATTTTYTLTSVIDNGCGGTVSGTAVIDVIPQTPIVPVVCSTTFQKTFGEISADVPYSLQQTNDGGYIITGYTGNFGAGSVDVYLIKTDINGDTLWTKAYGGALVDEGYSVQQTTDGGYIIAGRTQSFGAGGYDAYLIKTDINGNLLWSRTYGGAAEDRFHAVQQTVNGGYIITGSTASYGAGGYDVYLIRTNANGDTLWTKTFGGTLTDAGRSVQQTADGGYIIGGVTWSFGAGSFDAYLIRTDSSGNILWTKTYGGTGSEYGNSVQQTTDGGYILAGHTNSFGAGDYDAYLIKTDAIGDTLWTKVYGGSFEDKGYVVQQTPDDGYIVAGYTNSFGAGNYDVYMFRTDANGDTLWTKSYGGAANDGGWDIGSSTLITADNGFITAVYSMSYGVGGWDVYLIKTDADGNSGCHESATSTIIGNTATQVGSGATIGFGAIVGNPATIVSNTSTIDSILCSVPCQITPPPIPCITTFQKTFGGIDDDIAYSVQQTSDGGYVITGETKSFGSGNRDVYLIKTDANGDTLWTRTFGGTVLDQGYSIQQTIDGGYIIAGETNSFGAGSSDVFLIKTDANGDTLWTRTYGGSEWDEANSVQQTSDGGYIVVGETRSFGTGVWHDVYLIKTDTNGDTLWTKTYGGNNDDFGYSVQETTDSGFIVAGYTKSFGQGTPSNPNVYLIRTDANGDTLWTKIFGGNSADYCNSVQQTSDGGFIVAGYTFSFGAGNFDIYLIKTDLNGDTLWTKTYGENGNDQGYSVQQTADGGYIITGFTTSFGAGGWDVYLIKTDTNGNILWTKTIGGTTNEGWFGSIRQTTDGGYIVAGRTNSFGAGSYDVYLIKTDANGNTGCNESSTNTIGGNPSTIVSSTATLIGSGAIVGNPATIISNTATIDSVLCFASIPCDSVIPPPPCITTFQKTYGGDSSDCAYALLQTSDSGYVWVGSTNSFGAGGYDIYMVKTDIEGDTLWTKSFGGVMNEHGYSVQQTADSGYIVAGLTYSFGSGGEEAYLLKTDLNGNAVWMKTYGGTAPDRGTSVQQTTDGGYILGGSTESYGAGSTAFYLIKTDANGDTLWTKTYGGSNSDLAHSVQQTSDNGYIIAGYTYGSFGAGSRDFYIIKTDSIGDTLWTRTYGGVGSDIANYIQQTNDGGYIIVGHTMSFGAGNQDIYVVKTDGNGDTLWTKVYGGAGNEDGLSVKQLPDSGYIIVGNTESFGAGMKDVYLIRTDINGDTLWTKTYGGVIDDIGITVALTNDAGFIIGGCTQSYGLGGDCYIIKVDSSGNSSCNQSSTGTVVGATSTQMFSGAVIGSGATVTSATVNEGGTSTSSSALCFVSCDSSYIPNTCAIIPGFSADTVCLGDSTSFTDLTIDTISNIILWRWYFGDGDSIIGVQNPKHLYTFAGTFLVELIVGNDSIPACFNSIIKLVKIVDTLTANAPPDTTICIGDSAELGPVNIICGTPPFSYTWTPGSSLNDSTAANPNAGPLFTTTYYITVTDSQGAVSMDSITIYVDTGCCRSWALIGSDTNYCFGDTVFFTNNSIAKIGATYIWDFGPNAIPSSSGGATPPPVYFDTTGVFPIILILTDSCGIDTGYHNVNIYPAPIADAGTDTAFCAPDTVQIGSTPVSGHSYIWAPATGLSDSIAANPFVYTDSSVTYVVVVTDNVSDCTDADSITITMHPPIAAEAGNDTAHCAGDSLQLNATGGIIYSWTPSTGLSNDSIADPWAIVNDTTTYFITVTDSNNCTDTDSITITLNQLPNVDAGSDTSICSGDSVQLTASGGIIFAWSPANDLSDDSIQNPWASPLDTTVYFVTVEDSLGCSNIDSIVVSVLASPTITATVDTAICLGDIIIISSTSSGTYFWNTGDTTQSITVAPTDDSLYIVSTSNVCGSDSDSVWVLVNLLPMTYAGQNVTISLGNSTQLSGLPSGIGLSYSWSPFVDLSCSNCQYPLAYPENTTTYYLTVTDSLGCTAMDTVIIMVDETMVLFIPNIFSPNGDGENDYFYIQGKGIDKLNLAIYDRWGENVFEINNFLANDPYMGWDGTYKGKEMNSAVFVYVVTGNFINGSEINEKGDLTLVK